MKRFILSILVPLLAFPAFADFTNNQSASGVLGKADFADGVSTGPTDSITGKIEGVAIDPISGKLFVADATNHRILRFSATAAYQTGASAEAVLGQADFVSGSANRGGGPAANTLSNPSSLSIDAAGRLWVADTGNHRILRFENAASKGSGAAADGVLGQGDFVSNLSGLGAASFDGPGGVFADSAGRLWVGDSGNHRVLRFDGAAGLGNGASAVGVLGQADLNSDAAATSAVGMNGPWGISGDATGRIWVADTFNNRVLRFNAAASKANGAAADAVLGQADFTTSAAGAATASNLFNPYYLTAAPNGYLWVGDSSNRRVVAHRSGATKASGSAADIVLGQPDFLQSSHFGPTQRSIVYSSQIAVDRKGMLFVGDFNLRRVLRFAPGIELRAPSRLTTKTGKAKVRGTSVYADRVEYKAPGSGFRRAQGSPAKWSVRLNGLVKRTTKVQVRAVASDGRQARRTVTVKLRK